MTSPGYATTDLSNGITVGGLTIAPANPTNNSDPNASANNPTIITFSDGTTQKTSAINLSAMMAVIFGG